MGIANPPLNLLLSFVAVIAVHFLCVVYVDNNFISSTVKSFLYIQLNSNYAFD